jgi:hypothetical protein
MRLRGYEVGLAGNEILIDLTSTRTSLHLFCKTKRTKKNSGTPDI